MGCIRNQIIYKCALKENANLNLCATEIDGQLVRRT